MSSLVSDPMSWWPLGVVIGGVIGAGLRRHDRRVAQLRKEHGDSIIVGDQNAPDADNDQYRP
jgi:hypothetical protein